MKIARLEILRPEHIDAAAGAFESAGVVALDRVLPADLIGALRAEILARYGGSSAEELERAGSKVGDERWMIAVDLSGPFLDPRVYANPSVLAVVKRLLGERSILASFTAVIAYPGAGDQHVHFDHSLLFDSERLSMELPSYAITVVMPLIDLDASTGGTRVWPLGKRAIPSLWHRLTGSTLLELPAGSSFLMDYRVLHGGTANPGHVPRPVLYLVYAKPWFRDAENFGERPPIRIGASALRTIPEEHRTLMSFARWVRS